MKGHLRGLRADYIDEFQYFRTKVERWENHGHGVFVISVEGQLNASAGQKDMTAKRTKWDEWVYG